MPGTLYLLISRRTGCHKIGITRNVQQRYKALEVGIKADEVARWRVPNPEQLELFLHRRFKAEREPQTEWFHLSPDQVQWVVSAASKAADDLKQATNHQPPQPVVHRHPVQPAERPRPHTYQPAQTPLRTAAANRAQRNAQQTPAARSQQAQRKAARYERALTGHWLTWCAVLFIGLMSGSKALQGNLSDVLTAIILAPVMSAPLATVSAGITACRD